MGDPVKITFDQLNDSNYKIVKLDDVVALSLTHPYGFKLSFILKHIPELRGFLFWGDDVVVRIISKAQAGGTKIILEPSFEIVGGFDSTINQIDNILRSLYYHIHCKVLVNNKQIIFSVGARK